MNDQAAPSRDLLTTAKARFREAMDHQASWREQAEQDYAFVAGDQWDQADIDRLREQMRPAVTFNRVAPMIQAVAGHEVNNRQEVRYIPRERGDVGVNELLTGAADWARDECDAEDEDSDAFFDCVVCGMGWTETRMDWEDDPQGEVRVERVDPFEVWWDPSARKRNVVDGRYLFRVKDMSLEDAMVMFPEFSGATTGTDQGWGMPIGSMSEPHHTISGDQYKADETGSGTGTQRGVRIVEYQWVELEQVVSMQDPMTGQIVDMTPEQAAPILERMLAMGIPAQPQQRTVRRVYRAFFAGDQVLWEGPNADPERFTYQCITGQRDRNNNTWFGLVRSMKDPQRWANKFFSQMMHIINTNSKGGLIAEATAFDNPRKAEEDWAKPDAIVWMQDGAVSEKRWAPKPVAEVPTSLVNMMQFALGSLREVTGVNLEMLGMAEREQPGVLEYQRKQAGLTILATLFDSLRRYRKNQGRVLLTFITRYISDGRLVRIKGQDGSQQYVPLVRDESVRTYDVIVDDAPSSPNQKDRTWQLLVQMIPIIAGTAIPPQMLMEILRASPLPESFINRIGELLEQASQPDLTAQAAQQIELAKGQAEVRETHANAELDEVKAAVELAMLPVKQAETAAKARAAMMPKTATAR